MSRYRNEDEVFEAVTRGEPSEDGEAMPLYRPGWAGVILLILLAVTGLTAVVVGIMWVDHL